MFISTCMTYKRFAEILFRNIFKEKVKIADSFQFSTVRYQLNILKTVATVVK